MGCTNYITILHTISAYDSMRGFNASTAASILTVAPTEKALIKSPNTFKDSAGGGGGDLINI